MRGKRIRRMLKSIYYFMVVFALVAFVISCCMMLFVSTLAETLDITFTKENISMAAKLTFGNVVLISILLSIADGIKRKITIDRPVKKITEAAEQIIKGDFTTRITPPRSMSSEDGFGKIIACFNKLTKELSGIETLKGDFIANVSHEMKTPLSVIHNYGTLLQAPDINDEKRMEYAKGVTDASRRLSDMMTNILKLSRLENQEIYPSVSEFDLGEQLCECLLGYENVWERANIEIETDIAEDVKVKADSELLSLVWNNLFSNAFKFTPEGGKVSVSLTATAHHAIVKVSDTGCGMSTEVGQHIFEKFYQGDTSRSTHGNGLGLALVKRVIDIMHAEIGVESTVGKGSTFTVRIRRG